MLSVVINLSVCLPVGFMTPEERKVFENIRSPHLKYWIPVVWFSNLASKARQEGRIQDSIDLQNILNVTHRITLDILSSVTIQCMDRYRGWETLKTIIIKTEIAEKPDHTKRDKILL